MGRILKTTVLGLIGGSVYVLIELAWRGYSHPSMFLLGAILFLLIGGINERFDWLMPLWKQCAISAIIITVCEFITGCVVNLLFGWNVWHYDSLDILGQISLPYMLLWFFISLVAIVLDDVLRWRLFDEERPRYYLF